MWRWPLTEENMLSLLCSVPAAANVISVKGPTTTLSAGPASQTTATSARRSLTVWSAAITCMEVHANNMGTSKVALGVTSKCHCCGHYLVPDICNKGVLIIYLIQDVTNGLRLDNILARLSFCKWVVQVY